MKNYSTVLFRFFMLLVPFGLFAQELPEVVPPTPEAASLGKFTEMPISHYTGLPNISVPISSFSVGNKSFPVSISYHARGIQVPEIASRVGTGWALNAGGQISRQVRHVADEQTDGYVGRYNLLMDRLVGSTNFFDNFSVRQNYNISEQGYISSTNGTPLGSVNSTDPNATGFRFKYDRIPDQFSLSVGELSAKFILNYEDDQPLLQKYDDIVINYTTGSDGISSFEVIDRDGYKYSFGVGNISNWQQLNKNYVMQLNGNYVQSNPTNVHNRTNNTWLLTKIESPNGDVANLIYTEEVYEQFNRSYDERVDYANAQYNNQIPPGESVVSYGSQSFVHEYQLSEIRFNYNRNNLNEYDKIEFVSSNNNRQDLRAGAKELNEINIYNYNTLIKSYLLHQSYRANEDNGHQNQYYKAFEPESGQRLFLDSITEVGNNLSKPPYVFEYDPQPLPNRFSNSQDLWGYYNGAPNGEFLLFMNGMTTNAIHRSVDTLKSQAGMLERIKYPTGGSTRFIYEHNKGIKGSEFNNIRFPKVNPGLGKNLGLSPIANYDNTEGVYKTSSLEIVSRSQVIPIVNLPINWDGYNQNAQCIGSNGGPYNDCYFSVKLIPIVNGVPQINDAWHLYSDATAFWVDPGEYQLVVDPPNNWDPALQANATQGMDSYFNVALLFEDQLISEDDLLYASGKRIKQIEFLDSADNVVSTKHYEYKDDFGNDSGVILSIPNFGSLAQLPSIPSSGGNSNAFNNSVFSEYFGAVPGSPYSTYQGNTIGYSHVKEYSGDKDSNHGLTSYEFLVPIDTGDYMSYPVTPPTDNEWLRGLPKYIRSYKNDNGTYKKVKEIENSYLYGDELLSSLLNPLSLKKPLLDNVTQTEINQPLGLTHDVTRKMFRLPLINLFNDDINGTSYKIYHFTGGALDTRKTVEREFDNDENVTLVTESETEFNYNYHYQPLKVTSVTSDGIPVIETFTYPQNIYTSNRTTEEQDLVDQNRLVVLQVRTYRDENQDGHPGFAAPNELKSTTKTIYKHWGNGMLEPEFIQTAKGDNALEDRIEFKDYDEDGNVLWVKKTDGMDICYIYGYDNTLPVAKIENATYTQVQPLAYGVKNASDSDTTSCMNSESCNENTLRAAQTILRNSLPNAMVTTYTYDPLIGVTSMTDPKGYTVYYEYDDLNRLKRVKDADGNIMSENDYHYLLDD